MLTSLLKEFHAHYNKKSTFLHVFFGYLCFFVNGGIKMLFYGGLKMLFFGGNKCLLLADRFFI